MRTITKYLSMLMVVLSILVFASQTKAQITLMTQGWETGAGTTPPAGWAIDQLGYGNWITFVTSGSFPTTSPFEGSRMVRFDSWDALSGYQNRLRMSTPISTVGYSNITVDFALSLQNVFGPGDGLTVEWSTNGTVWTTAGSAFYNNGGTTWVIRTQVLPVGAANQANLYVAFHFISNYGYDTYVDICHIKGSQTGNLTGTVRNCNTNAVMPGVSVSCGGVGPVLTNGSGVYTLNAINAGPQTITATFAGFTPYSAAVTVVGNTTTTYNFCMFPIPGIINGVVTNAANGNPVVGAKVTWSTYSTYSVAGGVYSMNVYAPGPFSLLASKEGFDNFGQGGVTATVPAPPNTTVNIALSENTPPPSQPFTAALNAGQTAVNLNWGLPKNDMVLIYDDGIQDNFAIWATGGGDNLNAMKFTPISYPALVWGFYVNIGTAANYPAGSNAFSPIQMAIWSEVGGLPGVQLSAPTTLTPTVYGWTKKDFTVPVSIPSGNFFIVMIQLGTSAASPGLAIDTTIQQMRSYSKFGSTPWIPGPGNFMIRGIVYGSGGPLFMGDQSGAPITASAVPGLIYQYSPATVTGVEGSPKVYPEMGLGPDNLLGYQVWRMLQGQGGNPLLWTSIGTTTNTNIVDNSWPSLPCGPYQWVAEAQYTFNRWSNPTLSSVIGKCWTCNVTVNVDLSCDSANATGALVKLQNTTVVDTSYTYVMTATGTHTFTNFWKGIYTLTVTKYGYTVYTQTPISIMGDMTFNVMLLQIKTPPTGLRVPDTTLLATWFPPSSQSVLFNETFSSNSFATNQWVVDGGSNWSINTVNGNPGSCAQFFWSPEKVNYSYSVTSKLLTGVFSPIMKLKYDIHLDNFSPGTLEQLAVEIWNGSTWTSLANYDNSSGNNIPYTTETKDISAYANISFKVRFRAYGEDSYNIDWWDFDNVQIIAMGETVNPNPCILGYNFYLNNVNTGFTPDTFYQIPSSLVTYGSAYHACVLAVYGSGYSTQSCYDFTSKFLCPPNTLVGTAIECTAYLTWQKPDCGGCTLVTYQYETGTVTNGLSISVGFNIQMGNLFPVTPATTTGMIKSFDMWFTQAGASTGQNCIVYIYNSAYALIGQSPVFVNTAATYPSGTWVNVACPDIPYTGPFYALVDYYITSSPIKNYFGFDGVTPQSGYPNGLAWVNYSGVFSTAVSAFGGAYGSLMTWLMRANVCVSGKNKDAPITTIDPSQLPVSNNVTPIPNAAVNCGANINVSVGQPNTPPEPASPDAVTLLGYRVYRNNAEIAIINDPNTLVYYDYDQNPGTYQYKVNAWYNVSPFVPSPAHSQPAGPVSVLLNCGYPLPFSEPWDGGSFGYQQWTFSPSQANWSFNTAFGNPTPCADFSWEPILTNYSRSLITPTINASAWTCADIFCDFDIKLIDRFATGNEKLTVEILNNGNWVAKGEYTNTGSFDWTMKHIDISNVKGKAFKVRFRANGVSSGDILHWYVDNIHIYGVCHAPQTLAGVQNEFTTTLTWVAPDCPTGGGGPPPQWIHWDDGTNFQSIGNGGAVDFWIAARWDAAQIVTLDEGSITKIAFWPASAGTATYSAMIWEGPTPNSPVVNQPIPTVVNDSWNIVTLTTPHPIDISQELWIGVDVNASGGYPAGCDAGPEVDGYGNMIYWTGAWATLTSLNPSLTYNWNVQAYVEPSKKEAGARSTALQIQPPVNNFKGQTLGITGKTNTASNASFNSGSGLIIQDSPKGSQLLGYNVYSTDDNQITPFHKVNLSGPVTSPYTDVHPSTTEPTTTWKYFVTAVFQDSLNPGPVLCEPSSDTITITFPAVGINDLTNSSLSLYPNPANDVVNIVSTNDIKTIEVLNYIGQTVYTNNNVNLKKAQLNVTSFKSGVYFVKITTASGIKTTKITVTH
ncbi:MAG: T9SS C-terminal target domain-containing protein [Bacteroidetes bacterium]|nr:MAG: T9SS C-terminal target domain-containing protein [Bacteroidota bacterium]